MPPKNAKQEPVVETKPKDQINVVVNIQKSASESNFQKSTSKLRVKLISEWLDCNSISEIIGENSNNDGNLTWIKSSQSEEILECSIAKEFDVEVFSHEKLIQFHSKPGMYAFIMKEVAIPAKSKDQDSGTSEMIDLHVVGMIYLDCSMLLIKGGSIPSSPIKLENMTFSITVEKKDPILKDFLNYEPLIINLNRIKCFPVYEDESSEEASNNAYMYGEINLDGKSNLSIHRMILCQPFFTQRPVDTESVDELDKSVDSSLVLDDGTLQINYSTCILPGLCGDIEQFKDFLSSSTFTIELHKEDIMKRALHPRNTQEYNQLWREDFASVPDPKQSDKKAAPAKAKGKGTEQPIPTTTSSLLMPVNTYGPLLRADKFILECTHRGLQTAKQIYSHGTARFRLEQLLRTSNDILRKFERKHNGMTLNDDRIVVHEEIVVEVRMVKPSKPDKWDLPADISLRSAFKRADYEMQSKLDGTLALQSTSSKKKNRLPRYEMYGNVGTHIILSAEINRKLLEDKKLGLTASPTKEKPSEENMMEDTRSLLNDEELSQRLLITPFTRMILKFEYLDDEVLHAINNSITRINSKALPNIQGTVRSYSYDESELKASLDGSLNVISGCMIIDDTMRLVILEGLAGPGLGMQTLFMDLPRIKPNDPKLTILCNPEVLFPSRIYPEFGPDIKRIRTRQPLHKLSTLPEIYNRKQVEEICFEAIDGLMKLSRAHDMISTKKLSMYPSAAALNKLELLYGEAITRTDMDGTLKVDFHHNFSETVLHEKKVGELLHIPLDSPNIRMRIHTPLITEDTNGLPHIEKTMGESSKFRTRPAYEPTECHNEEYENILRRRNETNYNYVDHVAVNRQLRMKAWEDMLRHREEKDRQYVQSVTKVLSASGHLPNNTWMDSNESNKLPKIYLYSQQSLNYKSIAMNELRKKVAKDKKATYSFSKDFISQTVTAVDPEDVSTIGIGRGSGADDKSHWLTKNGFEWPIPKTREELIKHKDRPSDARIEELQSPFYDQRELKALQLQEHMRNSNPLILEKEKGFKTQINSEGLFGGLASVQYEHDFQLKLVGDRHKLPRGGLLKESEEKDPNYFRSVHLGGKEHAKLVEDAKAEEKALWSSKVVVDHHDFKVGGYKQRDVSIPINRTNDILKGEPKTLALKMIRELKSNKGKDISYATSPLSILSSEPHTPATPLTRKADHSKFITSQDIDNDLDSRSNAKPKDFELFIHPAKGAHRPNDPDQSNALHHIVTKRKHPTLDRSSAECSGPKWEPA